MAPPPASPNPNRREGSKSEIEIPNGTDRIAMGCVSVLFGLLAFWIGWIVANFLDGDGWFDFVVGLVLHEVIVSVGLLALALLIWAIFAPVWMSRVFEAASEHALKAAAIFFIVLIAPALLLAIGWSALASIGIVK